MSKVSEARYYNASVTAPSWRSDHKALVAAGLIDIATALNLFVETCDSTVSRGPSQKEQSFQKDPGLGLSYCQELGLGRQG